MGKRIIIFIIFLSIMFAIHSFWTSAFQLTVEHDLAIEQVEPDDAVAIGMRSIDKWRNVLYVLELVIVFIVFWYILGKPIKNKMQENVKQE